jgi:hypothetical protein
MIQTRTTPSSVKYPPHSLAHTTCSHEATSFVQRPALQPYLKGGDRLLLVHHEQLLHAGVVEHAPLLARAYRIEVGTFISRIDLLATVSCYAAVTPLAQHHSGIDSKQSHRYLRVVMPQQLQQRSTHCDCNWYTNHQQPKCVKIHARLSSQHTHLWPQ